MINVIPDPDTGKIIQIQYQHNNYEKEIEVYVAVVTNNNNPGNVGTILETYRKMSSGADSDAETYFKQKQTLITKYIGRTSISFLNFTPDHIICFFPNDVNRHNILKLFLEKITKIYNNRVDIDFSNSFVKNDPKKSIKEGLTAEDYNLVLKDNTPLIKSLLIIDDVIDTGDTINIYLTKLFEKGFINNDTVIKVACIYNNAKTIKKENVLEALKKSNPK